MLRLDSRCVLLDLEATSKEGILGELARRVHVLCDHVDPEALQAVLLEREQLGSTGVGGGVAIPHGKLPDLAEIHLCFGRCARGVGFDAVDNKPVQLFVLILSPASKSTEYLRTLAQVSRLLKDPLVRERLLSAATPEEVVEIFATSG